ncbi:MAG TPA: hypothetical protein VHM26_05585 [Chitinophagaceae bacterium]|jgi:hypothetical protein|nr:hypothetical protein [Chitinophagaceae bacterium]
MRVLIVALSILSSFTLFAQNNKDSLVVFVGEKIDVRKIPDDDRIAKKDTIIKGEDTLIGISLFMDSEFKATYKILKLLNGHYTADTISFYAYDHYGWPAFSKYNTVLLFVYPYPDKNIHEKYQFYPLYKTKDERWAGVYAAGDFQNTYLNKSITVQPEKIEFDSKLSFDLTKVTDEMKEYFYPAPFFIIKNNKATPVYGNYVEDLFRIKQQGILRNRGYDY